MKIIEKILSENLHIDNDTFIFDIETTGLNPKFCKIILIGILYNCQDKTIIKQFFAENEDDEKELLTAFVEEIKRFKRHVTYNGLAFDIGSALRASYCSGTRDEYRWCSFSPAAA